MQVLNLYTKMMAWLETADPTVCVQTNTWTAAVLQLAIQFCKVLPSSPATYMHDISALNSLYSVLDILPLVSPHVGAAYVLALSEQQSDVSAKMSNCPPPDMLYMPCRSARHRAF